jgi:predicted Zn-dependent protease
VERAACVAAAVIALSACGAAPRHAPPVIVLGVEVPAQCQRTDSLSVNDNDFERCMGFAMDRVLMAATFRSYDDAALTAYVTSVGERLVAASGKPIAVTFRVIDDPDPEAFANLGGTIYVARGALARLRDEAELAALLGHEIGHELAGHMREALFELFRGAERSRAEQEVDLR